MHIPSSNLPGCLPPPPPHTLLLSGLSLLHRAVALTQCSLQLKIYFCFFFVVSWYLVRQLSSLLKYTLISSLLLEHSSVDTQSDRDTGEGTGFNFMFLYLKSLVILVLWLHPRSVLGLGLCRRPQGCGEANDFVWV